MPKRPLQIIMLIVATFALLVLVLNFFCLFAHGATTSSRRPNAFGAVISDINPNLYLVGRIVNGSIHECDHNEWCTTLSLAPFGGDLLLPSPTLTLCGDEAAQINEANRKSVWIAFVYRRQGTRIYSGIVCHDLTAVIPVAPKVGK